MMGYKLTIETSAEKEISKLQPEIRQRIVEKVGELTNSPRPSGCRKLRVMDGYRIRIGDYRVLYTVDDAREVITIFRVMRHIVSVLAIGRCSGAMGSAVRGI